MKKEDFIQDFQLKNEENIINKQARERRRNRFSLRNVLASISLLIGIMTLGISIIVYISYKQYGTTYNRIVKSLDVAGIPKAQQNALVYKISGSDMRLDWSAVYEQLAPYLIGICIGGFAIAIILWGFFPNFKFSSLFTRKGRNTDK